MLRKPGVWRGSEYLGRLPFEAIPSDATIVGAAFDADLPARWMDDDEYTSIFATANVALKIDAI